MIVRAAGNDIVAQPYKLVAHGLAVFHDVEYILPVLLGAGFLRGDSLGSHDMLERAALHSRKDGTVHLLCKLLRTEYHAAARPAQGLVRGGGDDIGKAERRRVRPGGDKPRDVRHVHHEIGTPYLPAVIALLALDLFRCVADYLIYSVEVDNARIGARSGQHQRGAVRAYFLRDVVIVQEAVFIDVVERSMEEPAAEIDRRAVRKMAAVIEVHRKDGVAGLDDAQVRGHVRLRAAVRLDVHMVIGAEHLAPFMAAILLYLVNILTAAVVAALSAVILALSGVTFAVLIRKA